MLNHVILHSSSLVLNSTNLGGFNYSTVNKGVLRQILVSDLEIMRIHTECDGHDGKLLIFFVITGLQGALS